MPRWLLISRGAQASRMYPFVAAAHMHAFPAPTAIIALRCRFTVRTEKTLEEGSMVEDS